MSLFSFLKPNDIHSDLEKYNASADAILLDVRTPQEYKGGHIPKSKNLPLQNIEEADRMIKDKNIPLYVYCQSGARSMQATKLLKHMGYTDVTNIGGIVSYSGQLAY